MAITFEDEEKRSSVGTFLGIFLFLAVVGVAGFFGVRYLMNRQQAIVPSTTAMIQLNKEVLSDPRLDSLELMPEIVPGEDPVGRENPFTQPSPEAVAAAAKARASAASAANDKTAGGPAPVTPGTLSPILDTNRQ